MPGKSKKSAWCLLRDDDDLKLAIRHQMNKKGLNVSGLAKEVGVVRYRLSLFLNHKNSDVNGLTQFDVMQVCMYLGIRVSLDFRLLE